MSQAKGPPKKRYAEHVDEGGLLKLLASTKAVKRPAPEGQDSSYGHAARAELAKKARSVAATREGEKQVAR